MSEEHWSHEAAVGLCRLIEPIAKQCGCHVALTGGTLYKDGDRKDCDILFYRVRQIPEIEIDLLFKKLADVGVVRGEAFSDWLIKATYCGRNIDCFFPEGNGQERWVNATGSYAGVE
jgi:hypothetical protein